MNLRSLHGPDFSGLGKAWSKGEIKISARNKIQLNLFISTGATSVKVILKTVHKRIIYWWFIFRQFIKTTYLVLTSFHNSLICYIS